MNTKPILIVTGEPFSVFSEILFKTLKKNKFKKSIVVIGSFDLLNKQMKFLKYNIPIKIISHNFKEKDLDKKKINLININFKFKNIFKDISNESNLLIICK